MQDDLNQLLGIQQTPEQQASLKELARRANDTFRVQNPLDDDYYVEWDMAGSGGRFLIPGRGRDIGFGKGQAVHPRYIAFKFFKEITQIILSAKMQAAIEAENKAREARGAKHMDKTFETGEELTFVMRNNLKTNDPDSLLALLPTIILGVEKEWGMDAIPYQKTQDKVRWDEVNAIINRKAQPTLPKGEDLTGTKGDADKPKVTPKATKENENNVTKGVAA